MNESLCVPSEGPQDLPQVCKWHECLMQEILLCKPGKSGVSYLGQSIAGIQETKKVRGMGRKIREGTEILRAA